jgi:nucleotide-binding universal stress UspA family protein
MSTAALPAGDLYLVVGYDGSDPARRALDAAVGLLHEPNVGIVSAAALADIEVTFGEVAQELRAEVGERLRGLDGRWGFAHRQGLIADQLIAVAKDIRDAHADDGVVIVVGSSSHARHRVVGSVPVSLARHSPVPLVIVP